MRRQGTAGQFQIAFSAAIQPAVGRVGDTGAMSLQIAQLPFHAAVAAWFARAFPASTEAQSQAWPHIAAGRHTLVAAPTGSGKTLTAFLAGIDALVRQGLDAGLPDAVQIVYVSPLKALSNDIRINLEQPLAGIREALAELGLPDVPIRTAVRTGDTSQAERAALRRQPPHILVTTPESLYVLLGSDSGRALLGSTRSVIVDEIHALADDKRGSHLALSLQRLEALCGRPLQRIGLSATQNPIDAVARFLVGAAHVDPDGKADCAIVDIGYSRRRDLALQLPQTPLQAVMSHAQWEEVYNSLADLAQAHSTTLVFVNTRRMAERVSRQLSDRLGTDRVAAHHGSLAKESRLDAEQRLKSGALTVLVATASLELGIDIGDVDLVCQIGSPRSIAAFLQRVGRSGHHVGGVPKGRLFPTSREELVECAALLDCVRRGELDVLQMPTAPLDVLAQQIVAEVNAQEWQEDALFDWLRRAWPYAALARADFDVVVGMLAEGFSSRRGPRAGWIHRDAVHGRLRGRRGGRTTALMSGGTIPDTADYTVILEPEAHTIGTVNEDFAVESTAGDIFQLGNASYRILRVEPGRVRVEDAKGLPPSIPFWLGEAPGRTDALSLGVSRLRDEVAQQLQASNGDAAAVLHWLIDTLHMAPDAAEQLLAFLHGQQLAIGVIPTQTCIVLERFFDESGGTQLVIHSPFGSRINRAWGLALRKRFCRKFNFELQAAATEDAIVLSLSTSHSFPLIEVAGYLHSASAQHILVQALLDAPLFGVRWRWVAGAALALPRFIGGKKVAPQLQRMKSEDFLASVFPDQVACLENIVGERQVPDHPLVAQTLHDCLHEAMDCDGWLALLRGIESGVIRVEARDVTAPSPFAAEALTARPYAFLDDAPLEERRTQAVQSRRFGMGAPGDLARLDPDAIASVREQAWPEARNADEMHEALLGLGGIIQSEAARSPGWMDWLQRLAADQRATCLELGDGVWVTAELLPLWQCLHPDVAMQPAIQPPPQTGADACTPESAARALVRARLGGLGPVTAAALATDLHVAADSIDMAMLALEGEGVAMRGRFTPDAQEDEWCERHLLARIHRYTLGRLRREIEPVEPRDFMRFLFDWQHVAADARLRGPDALAGVLSQLEGFEAGAGSWEGELLPARVGDYAIAWLDDLCTAGRIVWTRLHRGHASSTPRRGHGPVRATPVVLLSRREQRHWQLFAPQNDAAADTVGSRVRKVLDALREQGACFFDELQASCGLLQSELEEALAEAVAQGLVTCDSFSGLRALLVPASRRGAARHGRRRAWMGLSDAGRWSLTRARSANDPDRAERDAAVEHIARTLLRRYGVVCWPLLQREADWLPPWRDLLRCWQRLEARGEIRGGRFVAGLSGEQFALPEAVAALRQVRQRPPDGRFSVIGAMDPLNLTGNVLAGVKVSRQHGTRILFRDGLVVATLASGRIDWMQSLPPADHAQAEHLLRRWPGSLQPEGRDDAASTSHPFPLAASPT